MQFYMVNSVTSKLTNDVMSWNAKGSNVLCHLFFVCKSPISEALFRNN